MTIATRPVAGRARASRNVVVEIAARRAVDVRAELDGRSLRDLTREARRAAPPRNAVLRFARPGTHLIAEVKRSSPSAGAIAAGPDDPVARARAYQAGGAAAISVLCEPHWFGGSVDDLRAVRAAVSVPVLAKEFVVDPRQLPLLRAAGADIVLLLAVLHRGGRLAELVDRALDLGIEPFVEVHDEAELDRALATHARIVGINNRDLRTLVVDPEQAFRLRGLVPEDRLVIAESGVREPGTIAGWRAVGFDGALVGEALMRSEDPEAAVRAFVAAGRQPDDPANRGRTPSAKICGITDAEGIAAAVAAGADAIGLNLVPGTPRALDLEEAVVLAREARRIAADGNRPAIVAVTADAGPQRLAEIVDALDPDAVQLSGTEPPELAASLGRPAWKVLHLPPVAPDGADDLVPSHRRPGAYVSRCGPMRAHPPRRIRRCASGRHRPPSGRRAGRGRRPAGAGHAGRGSRPGARRRGASPGPGARRRCRIGRGAAARRRPPAHQGSVAGRAVRQARPRRPPRPPDPRLASDARRPRASWRPTSAAGGASSGSSAAATSPRRSWPRSRTWNARGSGCERSHASGRSCATCWGAMPAGRRPSTVPSDSRMPSSRRPATSPARTSRRGCPRACRSTSSARTWPIPGPTRSTTPLARRS